MSTKIHTERLMRLAISPAFLLEALKGNGQPRSFTVENALPDDATLYMVHVDAAPFNTIWAVIKSEDFEPIKDGDLIPELPVPVCRIVR